MAVNSKKKGNRFERYISKFFKDWTGYEFSRTPQSGGLRWKKADNISSDIVCTDPKHSTRFPFSVECKFHHEIKFEHLIMGNKGCKISEFWNQVNSDAKRSHKLPLLIMRYNGMPSNEAFVCLDIRLDIPKDLIGDYMLVKHGNSTILIFMLTALKKLDYRTLYKQARKLVKDENGIVKGQNQN